MYHLATKIFNIFKSLIENVSVRGEDRREKVHISSTSGPKVKGGAHYFQARAHLLWGFGK